MVSPASFLREAVTMAGVGVCPMQGGQSLGVDSRVRAVGGDPVGGVQVLGIGDGVLAHGLIHADGLELNGVGSGTVDGGAVVGRDDDVGEIIAVADAASVQEQGCGQGGNPKERCSHWGGSVSCLLAMPARGMCSISGCEASDMR